MMPTICSDSVVIISVMFLPGGDSSATPAGQQGSQQGPQQGSQQDSQQDSQPSRISPLPQCSPLGLRPQQVGPQHNGHVARGHFVHVLVLGQLGQEFNHIPGQPIPNGSVHGSHPLCPLPVSRWPWAHLMLL